MPTEQTPVQMTADHPPITQITQPGSGKESAKSADRSAPDVAIVGRADAITAFRAVGLSAFAAEPGPDAVGRVEKLVADGYRVIFFTSELFGSLAPLLDRYRKSAVPCLVALPEGGTESFARLRAAVRKAVGADVFAERSV